MASKHSKSRSGSELPESRRKELGSPVVVSIRLREEQIAQLDAWAETRGESRTRAIIAALEACGAISASLGDH